MSGERDLSVVARSRAADDVVLLDLAREDGADLPRWVPGAHVDIVLPGELGERQYSLCGDPQDRSLWRIGVLREPGGRGGSVWLHEAAVGDRIRVRGPANHFAFEPYPGHEYLFIAGGIGITPISAMIRAAVDAGAPWRLAYAGRSRSTMAFVEDLIRDHGDRVEVFAADEGRRAVVADLIDGAGDAIVFCCGPGRPAGHLRLERFEAREFGEPVWQEPFEVELMMTGATVTVPPGRSILDVAEEAGAFTVASCRRGTCGTCETPVVDGAVDHRDSVLSPEEQDDSRSMMICVSRAAGPHLVLEL